MLPEIGAGPSFENHKSPGRKFAVIRNPHADFQNFVSRLHIRSGASHHLGQVRAPRAEEINHIGTMCWKGKECWVVIHKTAYKLRLPITEEVEKMTPEEKLLALKLTLPTPAAPVANYVSYVTSGNLVFISGQISKINEIEVKGRLGEGLTVEQGQSAARLSALNLIAQMKLACGGDLSRVKRIVKLGGFVQATTDATQGDIPKVINGCSDLMVAVFGDDGRHARFAVSAPSLPLDVAVEIDAVVEIQT